MKDMRLEFYEITNLVAFTKNEQEGVKSLQIRYYDLSLIIEHQTYKRSQDEFFDCPCAYQLN